MKLLPKVTARKIMRAAMKAWSPEQRKNARAHARAGTRIYCGKKCMEWINDEGTVG